MTSGVLQSSLPLFHAFDSIFKLKPLDSKFSFSTCHKNHHHFRHSPHLLFTDLRFRNQYFPFHLQTIPSDHYPDIPGKYDQIPRNPISPMLFTNSRKQYEKIKAPVTDPKSANRMSLMAPILRNSRHSLFNVS